MSEQPGNSVYGDRDAYVAFCAARQAMLFALHHWLTTMPDFPEAEMETAGTQGAVGTILDRWHLAESIEAMLLQPEDLDGHLRLESGGGLLVADPTLYHADGSWRSPDEIAEEEV